MTSVHSKLVNGLNDGILRLRAMRNGADGSARTLIVSGLPRSGTSMVARALNAAGVFLGDGIDDVVYEDQAISTCLNLQDLVTLRGVIRNRNARFKSWGFKKPNIHDFINPKDESLFRNPYYMVTFRDPIAVAKRNIVSEAFDEVTALSEVISMQGLMAQFVLDLRHPVLLISYEKAIQRPSHCAESIIQFAGLNVDEHRKELMVASIEPNRPEYRAGAIRIFDGYLDGVRGDVLCGWCRQVDAGEPIAASIVINEKCVATVLADRYREDLMSAGVGSGAHAFSVDLKQFHPDPDDVVRVFARGRSFELANSGKTVRELRNGRPADSDQNRNVAPRVGSSDAL